MAKKIGVFSDQQSAIRAIEELEQAGFTPGEMKILAKDTDHSRRIEAETDTHVDEIRELAETTRRLNDGGPSGYAMIAGYDAPPIAGGYGMQAYGGAPFGGSAYSLAAPFSVWNDGYEGAYQALGLDTKETELCSKAVESGSIVLIAESDESQSVLEKDGGPDLSKLGVAEAVFRRCGAARIANGS
ncbi:general stress protein [Paenibacillus sp. GCM10027627]|uniref:general stress protein n=1 Tax=unclassified Paenibacillus TaxID=185978 RepID=UPI003640DF72